MAGISLGTAYFDLVPSMRGAQRSITSQLVPAASRAGVAGGRSAGSGISTGVLGSVRGLAAPVAGAFAGIFAAASIGKAFQGGFSRLLNIEDAQAKLKGLGNSTKTVTSIMDNALASVRGTAFGLDSAATVAASAVAAGIKPGQQLTKYLKLTADTATIAGGSLGDLGSILNQTVTSGIVYTDTLNQLSDRGIPVFTYLQKEYGVSAAALRDMVQKGEVDSAHLQSALQKNIGGAALASGNTTRGAFANLGASISRTTANLISGVFPAFRTGLQGITAAMAPVEARAKVVGAGIGAAFSGIGAAVGKVNFGGVLSALAPIGTALKTTFGAVLSSLAPVLPALGTAFAALGPQIAALLPVISPLGSVLNGFLPVLPQLATLVASLASGLGGALASAIGTLLPSISVLSQTLSGVLAAALPVIFTLVQSLATSFAAIVPAVSALLAAVLPLASALIASLAPIITQLVTTVLPPLAQIFGLIVTAIAPLITQITAVLVPVIQALLPVITTVFGAIVPVIQAAMQIVLGVIQVVTGIISGNWAQVWTGIQNIFGGVWNAIKAIVTGAISIVVSVIGSALGIVKSLWTSTWGGLSGLFSSAFSRVTAAVGAGISTVVGFFTGLPGKVTGALAGLGASLYSSGSAIIARFVGGIRDKIGDVGAAVSSVVSKVTDFLPHSPAKTGPLSGRGWTQLLKSGSAIVTQFSRGLITSKPQVVSAAKKVLSEIQKAWDAKKITGQQNADLNGIVSRSTDQLLKQVGRRTAIAAKLKAATKRLQDALKVKADYRSSTASNLRSFDATAFSSPRSLIGSLAKRVSNTKTFAGVMYRLRKSGLDATTYQQFIAAGVDALPQAKNLLAGGVSSIKKVASLQGQLRTASNALATTASNQLYGAGVDAARGLVRGLKSQQVQISKQMQVIAKSMVKSIKAALGIHSPSRVMRDQVGAQIVAGLVVGINRDASLAEDAMRRLSVTKPGTPKTGGLSLAAATNSTPQFVYQATPVLNQDPRVAATITGREFARSVRSFS